MADAKVQIGSSDDFLEGVGVDTPAGQNLFREGVVISDPDVAAARARITNTAPAADAYGLAVRVVGGVVVGSEVEIKNDAGSPIPVSGSVSVSNFPATQQVSGTVALDSASLNALESITVQNGAGAAAVNIQDGGNSITVDGTVSVGNFPASQTVNGTVTVQQSTAANLQATVTGTVQANNLVGGTAVSNANPLPISDAGGSITVDGTVAATQSGSWSVAVNNFPATQAVSGTISVGNFPATQAVSGTVTVSQATAANLNATVTGTVNVGNFPATQAVSGTVTANAGTGTFAVSAASLPLPTGAATSANQTTTNTTLASLDNKIPDESGAWGYNAGTSGTLAVAANKRVLTITATAGLTAGSMTINAGQTITIPANGSITISPKANLVAPTIVFTGTTAYFVEFVE